VAHAIHPIVLKYLLNLEETTKGLLECGVSQAANAAQISTGSFINRYATNRPTKQRELFQAT
jgi:phosphoheptose isomerase